MATSVAESNVPRSFRAFYPTGHHVSHLAQLGSETKHMREHLKLAKQGCDKMIVYAPTEHESRRVMNVGRRFDIRLAEKYHRLVIEHLEES